VYANIFKYKIKYKFSTAKKFFVKLNVSRIKKNNATKLLLTELLFDKTINNFFLFKIINIINISEGNINLKIFKILTDPSTESEKKVFGFTLRLAKIKTV
jgi:hypothetical protein